MGPESDKPSFSWVSKDIFDTLKDEYNVIYFRAFKEIPKSFDGLVFIIKEMPPLSFFVCVAELTEELADRRGMGADI